MKYISFLIVFVLFSCGKEESIELPKSDVTIVKEVRDYSPVYLFFRKKGEDTLVEVNRKNTISSTNWIFHIDKRLPLRLVIPEIIKLQAKKEGSVHKSETSQNYFSYSDSIHKSLAFISFSKVKYQLERPNSANVVSVSKNQDLSKLKNRTSKAILCFDKNSNFQEYIQYKIAIQRLNLQNISEVECIH